MRKIVVFIAAALMPTLAPAAEPDHIPSVDEVVVTGSRAVTDGAQAPTPLTVVSAEQLRAASPGPIGEALIQLPMFRGSTRPTTGGFSSTGPSSGSFLNLRNLGVERTLVLLDGRRTVPTTALGATDVNLLPQELVSRADIVTGGASAAYGSDAVAGVVNLVLDTRFDGLKGLLQGGVSSYGDNESLKASATGGFGFAADRGHAVLSASRYRSAGVQSLLERPWGREGRGTVDDPSRPGLMIITTDVNSALTSRGGLIVFSPPTPTAPVNLLRGLKFLPGAAAAPFDFGTLSSGLTQVGGDGARPITNLSADVSTGSVFGHASYKVTPSIEVFGELAWAEAHNRYAQVQQFQTPGLNTLLIFSGNAYLPAPLQATMTRNGIPLFALGRLDFDLGGPVTADALNDTWNGVAGFRGRLPGGWALDGYYEHGENRLRIRTENNVIHERLYAAADAVRDPGGAVVCRVQLTNPELYPGCTPINLFGEGSPSPEASRYVLGTAWYRTTTKQDVVALTARGEPFSTWAGPVAVGAGAEYRQVSVGVVSDPISQRTNLATGIRGFPDALRVTPGGFALTNTQPLRGSYDVKEGFVEALVPLAKDTRWARSLALNGALRLTDYSTSGTVTTWKVGASYEPVDGLRLRAARSRDIRAANIAELFAPSVQSPGVVFDTVNGGTPAAVVIESVGNPNLDPEKADTLTLGVVYQPTWLVGALLSLDYYDIHFRNVISGVSPQMVVDACAAGSAEACADISRDAAGGITRVVSRVWNLASRTERGIDIEAGYHAPVAGGDLAFRALISHLIKRQGRTPAGELVAFDGELLSSNPHWAGLANATYTRGAWSLFLQERFIGPGTYDNALVEGITINDNSVGAVFYTDMTVNYRFKVDGESVEMAVTINNLLNQAPPNVPVGVFGAFTPTNAELYDALGRYISIGIRLRY